MMSRAPHSSELMIIFAEDQEKDHFIHVDISTFSSTVSLGKHTGQCAWRWAYYRIVPAFCAFQQLKFTQRPFGKSTHIDVRATRVDVRADVARRGRREAIHPNYRAVACRVAMRSEGGYHSAV